MEHQFYDRKRIKDLPLCFPFIPISKFYSAGTFLDMENNILLLENEEENISKIKMVGGTADDLRILREDTYFEILEEVLLSATCSDVSRKWWTKEMREKIILMESDDIFRHGYRPERGQLVIAFLAKTGYYTGDFDFVWRQTELPRGLEQYYFIVTRMFEPSNNDKKEIEEVKIISANSDFKPLDPNVRVARILCQFDGVADVINPLTHQNAFRKGIMKEFFKIKGEDFQKKFIHLIFPR